ncbi:MAG: hypothetical protein U0230_02005 [Polyangiales bacterium]
MRAFVILLLFGVLGCGPGPRPRTPIDDADRALRLASSLHRTVHALSAEARVEQRGSQGRIRGTVLAMVALPDHVRFDVLTQFGPAAVLTSDGTRFELLDLRDDRFVEGPACPSNVARLLGFALPPADVARMLVGEAPLLPGATEKTIRPIAGGYELRLASTAGSETLVFGLRSGDHLAEPGAQHLRLARVELRDPAGNLSLRITYSDHRVVRDPTDLEGRGIALPFVIRVEDRVRDAETTIRVKSVELGITPPDEAFRQTAPGGATRELAPCD